ncbi:MAG: AAA family ATPase [Solirubrobacteraceae bacterium]
MRLARAHIVNFRCLRDLSVSFDDVTVLVGANSTGKSSVLHALDWFFRGGPLCDEDIHGHQPGERVTVGVTFTSFDRADRDALGSFVLGDEATVWRSWSAEDGEKLMGRARAYPAFAAVRQHARATEKRQAYKELCDAQPGLALPKANSAAAVDEALVEWEAAHPDSLENGRTDATRLFGSAGQARLASRMDFVLVPAIADPGAETQDARGTMLRQLLDRASGEQNRMRERLDELGERVTSEISEIMTAEGGEMLRSLARAVSSPLATLIPNGEVLLSARAPDLKMPSLSVDLRVADGELDTPVGHQGHGFQRALLIALVQQLAVLTSPPETSVDDGQLELAPSPPALVLALEEPELYQHPLQARHFAAMLASLAQQAGATIQVAYATHSDHFVDPSPARANARSTDRHHFLAVRHWSRRARAQPFEPSPESEKIRAVGEIVGQSVQQLQRFVDAGFVD